MQPTQSPTPLPLLCSPPSVPNASKQGSFMNFFRSQAIVFLRSAAHGAASGSEKLWEIVSSCAEGALSSNQTYGTHTHTHTHTHTNTSPKAHVFLSSSGMRQPMI